jgi:DNA-binding protein HU-beta
VNKRELIPAVAAQAGVDPKVAAAVLNSLEDVVSATIRKEPVVLTGFAKFEAVTRKARTARNPATGEPVKVKASKGVKIAAGASLKAVVNGPASTVPKLAKVPAKTTPPKTTSVRAAATKTVATSTAATKAPSTRTPAKSPAGNAPAGRAPAGKRTSARRTADAAVDTTAVTKRTATGAAPARKARAAKVTLTPATKAAVAAAKKTAGPAKRGRTA